MSESVYDVPMPSDLRRAAHFISVEADVPLDVAVSLVFMWDFITVRALQIQDEDYRVLYINAFSVGWLFLSRPLDIPESKLKRAVQLAAKHSLERIKQGLIDKARSK